MDDLGIIQYSTHSPDSATFQVSQDYLLFDDFKMEQLNCPSIQELSSYFPNPNKT